VHSCICLGDILTNAITHGIGAGLAIAGAICFIVASTRGTGRVIVSCCIFSAALVLVYLISTLYHSLVLTSARHVFHVLDHSAIYLLIAGTYTPFTLISLRGRLGCFFAVVWSLAVTGVVFKSIAMIASLAVPWPSAPRPFIGCRVGSSFLSRGRWFMPSAGTECSGSLPAVWPTPSELSSTPSIVSLISVPHGISSFWPAACPLLRRSFLRCSPTRLIHRRHWLSSCIVKSLHIPFPVTLTQSSSDDKIEELAMHPSKGVRDGAGFSALVWSGPPLDAVLSSVSAPNRAHDLRFALVF